jgi:hypothetical protein
MNTPLHTMTKKAHSENLGAKRGRLTLAAVGVAALFVSLPANAAPAPIIVNPNTLPDLTVSITAPPVVDAYQVSTLTVTVSNAPPVYALSSTTTDSVIVHLDLTGYVAQAAQGPAGFSCTVVNGNANTPWSMVNCTGPVAEGSSAAITVYFDPAADYANAANTCAAWYCGQPGYADASVSYYSRRAERVTTNNRAMSRIDTDGCIN